LEFHKNQVRKFYDDDNEDYDAPKKKSNATPINYNINLCKIITTDSANNSSDIKHNTNGTSPVSDFNDIKYSENKDSKIHDSNSLPQVNNNWEDNLVSTLDSSQSSELTQNSNEHIEQTYETFDENELQNFLHSLFSSLE